MAKVIIPLKPTGCFWVTKPKYRGLVIDDIIRMLKYVLKNYHYVKYPKCEFTRFEVEKLFRWLLYKDKEAPYKWEIPCRTNKQRLFLEYYAKKGGMFLGMSELRQPDYQDINTLNKEHGN